MKPAPLAAALLLAGCDDKPDTVMQTNPPAALGTPSEGGISVARIGIFEDGLAYSGKRGIYVITDTKTGQEFLGVSGIGISELGRHQASKNNYRMDER